MGENYLVTVPATETRTPAQFVEAFAEAWAKPTPDRLAGLLHPAVRLVTPLSPVVEGRDAARAEFARLLGLLPDLHAEVHRWGAHGDVVFIEFTLHARAGGRPFQWDVVDRFLLERGLARERVSYFDSLPLTKVFVRNPGLALRMLRRR